MVAKREGEHASHNRCMFCLRRSDMAAAETPGRENEETLNKEVGSLNLVAEEVDLAW